MPTRRQRRRWAAEGGRPRERHSAPPPPPPLAGPHVFAVDGQRFEAPTLTGLAELLRDEGHSAHVTGSTLHFGHRPPVVYTVTENPDPRVVAVHHSNRAKRRARGER